MFEWSKTNNLFSKVHLVAMVQEFGDMMMIITIISIKRFVTEKNETSKNSV